MSYLELLKLASPEAIVAITALAVLAIGLAGGGKSAEAIAVPTAKPSRNAGNASPARTTPATTSAAPDVCSAIAAAGIMFTAAAVLMLPEQATLFHGML